MSLHSTRPVRRTIRLLVGVALVVALTALAAYAVLHAAGVLHGYVITSGSMRPTIATGDLVLVADVPRETIAAGDVVTFRTPWAEQRRTTHRVVEVVQRGEDVAFRTKGDANAAVDGRLVPAEAVVGRVVYTVPAVGVPVVFAWEHAGLAAAGLAAAGLAAAGLLAGATLVGGLVLRGLIGRSGGGGAPGDSDAGGAADSRVADGERRRDR